jgi:hypothetical protein
MKLIFENWRKHINEQEEKTLQQNELEYFGSDIVSIAMDLLEEVRELQYDSYDYDQAGKLAANEISDLHGKEIRMLGHGSWRMGFLVDNKFVVKLNYRDSESGRGMNQDDERLGKLGDIGDLFPKVYQRDRNYDWIIMEKATPITNWDQILRFFPNRLLPEYDSMMGKWSFMNLFEIALEYKVATLRDDDNIIDSMEDSYNAKEYGQKEPRFLHLFQEKNPNLKQQPPLELVVSNFEYPLFLSLANLIAEFGIAIHEIRPGNTGIGEDGRFLLIDSSIQSKIQGAS